MVIVIGSILSALFGVIAGAIECVEDGKVKPIGWFLFTTIVIISAIMGIDAWLSGKTAANVRERILTDVQKQQTWALRVARANFELTKSEIETRSLIEASITQLTRYRDNIERKISQKNGSEARRELIKSKKLATRLVQERDFFRYSERGFKAAETMAEQYLKRASNSEDKTRKIELIAKASDIWYQFVVNNIRYAGSKILDERLTKQVQKLETLDGN
jgi:hypothetical protein